MSSQSKTIIEHEHVRNFLEKESQYRYQIQRKNPAKRTAQATGISRRTVDRIHKEFLGCDGQFLTPVKWYTMSRIRINLILLIREYFEDLYIPFMRKKNIQLFPEY